MLLSLKKQNKQTNKQKQQQQNEQKQQQNIIDPVYIAGRDAIRKLL